MTEKDQERTHQPQRGRDAETPLEVPPSGWKDILWRLYRSIAEDRILLTAAGVTFYILLALVPMLTAFVSIYGFFNDRADVLNHVELLAGIVPSGVIEIVREQLTRLTSESSQTLGLTFLLAFATALWSSGAGVKAMFEAMNVAFQEQERRSFLVVNGTALLFTLGGAFAALLVVGVVLIMPAVIGLLPGGKGMEWTVRIAAYLAMTIVLAAGLAALYRWGPSRQNAKWRWITPGMLLSVVALGVSSVLFSWYVENFSNNNATYGSLGAVIGLMLWLWIAVTLVIVGAELNAEIEHQTAQDTTTGHEEPLGSRGAHMADTVGRVWPPARGREAQKTRASPKRFSIGALAFAVPAAAMLHFLNSRRK